jgi:hypothetical protein
MSSTVHSPAAIADLLRRGLTPITDNKSALVELGFARAYPHVRVGYEATVWERSVEQGRLPNGYRVLARQRAFLV